MNLALLKKYLVLEICGVVILAALAVIGVKLVAAIRQYAVETGDLQAVVDRKQQLDRREPWYPSKENVEQEAENYKDILDSYNELNERLRARQIEPQTMQPADFMPLLENTLWRLRNQMAGARVAYPQKFTFSFERYAGGKLPAADDIPRLVQQLKIIEALCQALGKVGIAELVSISREEFEVAGRPESAAPRPNGQPWEKALYTTQHFKLSVKAAEASVFDLLNLLARLPLFTVVTSVEMANVKPTLREGRGAVTEESVSRERSIMLGKEMVELKLEMDVYQFAPSLDFRENADKKK